MAEQSNGNENVSLSVPVGVIATGVLLGLAGAIVYILMGRENQGVGRTPGQAAKSGKGMLRKVGLMSLVTLIENDATRKVVVAALKAMARRA